MIPSRRTGACRAGRSSATRPRPAGQRLVAPTSDTSRRSAPSGPP